MVKPVRLVNRLATREGFFSLWNQQEEKQEPNKKLHSYDKDYWFDENNTPILKITMVGKGMGKTQCINRFVNDQFDARSAHTLAVDFSSQKVRLGNHCVKLQIWDTSGCRGFRDMISAYFIGTHAFLLSFSLTDRWSFEEVKSLTKEIDKYNASCILVGNMCDLVDKRVVSYEEATRVKDEINALTYIECSAKTGQNIEKIFMIAAKAAFEKFNRQDEIIEEVKSLSSIISHQKEENDSNQIQPSPQAYQNGGINHFDALPEEVQIPILFWLDYKSRIIASQVSKPWRALIQSNFFKEHIGPLLTLDDIHDAKNYMNEQREKCDEVITEGCDQDWQVIHMKPLRNSTSWEVDLCYEKENQRKMRTLYLSEKVLSNYAQRYREAISENAFDFDKIAVTTRHE